MSIAAEQASPDSKEMPLSDVWLEIVVSLEVGFVGLRFVDVAKYATQLTVLRTSAP